MATEWANGSDKRYKRLMKVLPRLVDHLWDDEMVIGENDSRSWHTRERDFDSDRQRDAATHGFELSLGAAWPLGGGLDLRVRATYERYVYAFAPVPGDAYVAGGALDQIFHGGLAVGYAR